MIPHIAVLTFPGNNCENETVRALKTAGFHTEKIRWNQNPSILQNFDGVVIPGGFSFEDRGRSGVISAQEPIFQALKTMAKAGKPILGICNGAQMLVESGLILQTAEGIPSIALLPNKRTNEKGEVISTGFYHSWRTLEVVRNNTPFSAFTQTLSMPIAHGEGRFTVPETLQSLVREKKCVVFKYANKTNPNGSFDDAAAMCNPSGNVVAMMPHPERSEDGKAIFESLWNFFQEKKSIAFTETPTPSFTKRQFEKIEKPSIRILVSLRITDNTAKTFSQTLQTPIERWEIWDIIPENDFSFQQIKTLLQSGELINLHKQSVHILLQNKWYAFSKENGFVGIEQNPLENTFIVRKKEDMKGRYAAEHIASLRKAKVWFGTVWRGKEKKREELMQNPIFASYVGEMLCE